ncbi:FMN-binding protein [Flavobacteriaceae bacterium]|nr:FMN-binding protein [Flavobacteriaceae bacterium]
MKYTFTVLTGILFFVLMSFGLPKNVNKKVDKEISKFLDTKSFTKTPIVLTDDVQNSLDKSIQKGTFFKINNASEFVNYAYVGSANSHVSTFDYLVIFNKDFEVERTKVVIYREDYGFEITSKRWLVQFIGKNSEDSLEYDSNIDAISGATISARSMTKAMDNLLKSVKIIKENNKV